MERRTSMALSCLALPLALVSCKFEPRRAPIAGTGGTPGIITGTGGAGTDSDGAVFRPDAAIEYIIADTGTESGPSVDANCGNQPFTVIAPPPDLLIVLDRSGSMNEDAMGESCGNGGCGANSKWSLMTAALNEVVGMTETTVNWGLKFFASAGGGSSSCNVNAMAEVPVGPMNAAAIAAAIAGTGPGSSTPTRAAVTQAGAYLQTVMTQSKKFILLATDGEPTCGMGGGSGGDGPAAITAVQATAALGFPVFVIGIAADTAAGDTLNQMAAMGGVPRMGTPQYYSVSSSADLVAALGAIQTVVNGMCTYPLGTPGDNADPTKVTVTVDGNPSQKDDPNGWSYDPGMTSITFKGDTCTQLMAGTLRSVQVLFGCKVGPVI